MKRIAEKKQGDERVSRPRSKQHVQARTWQQWDYDRGMERMVPRLPVYLLLSVLILGCLLVVPNELDLRIQRLTNFLFIAMAVMGVYVLFDLSVTAGAFILFACFETFRGVSMTTLTFLLCMIGLFIAIAGTRDHWQPHKTLIYDALIFIAGVNLLFQVLQLCDIYWPVYPIPGAGHMFPGLMANPDEAFGLYMLTFPAFLRRRRWQLLLMAPVGLLFGSPLFNSGIRYDVWQHLGTRLQVWGATFEAGQAHSWFGAGFGRFGNLGIVRGGEWFQQAHNEFVEWYFIAGGIGFIIGLVFLFTYLRTSWANRDRIPFIGLVMGCIASSALFCWHEAPLAIITVLYLGMIRADGMKEAGHGMSLV